MFNTEVYRQDVERAAARVKHLTHLVRHTPDEKSQVSRFTLAEADALYSNLKRATEILAVELEDLGRARAEFELKMGRECWAICIDGGRVKEGVLA